MSETVQLIIVAAIVAAAAVAYVRWLRRQAKDPCSGCGLKGRCSKTSPSDTCKNSPD